MPVACVLVGDGVHSHAFIPIRLTGYALVVMLFTDRALDQAAIDSTNCVQPRTARIRGKVAPEPQDTLGFESNGW
ncbi:hypothetical protein M0657_008489 [Pyricularia oryzae]|nr:hypothetical protein M0657_008489 [Pyricularia oryzae]KAI7929457.1 hypothetical protein M9X92_001345 [Pyricularia oryzae]